MLEGLPAQWLRRGPVSLLLLPLAWVYGMLHSIRLCLYRKGYKRIERLPVPVIVVGNVVAGGAGKTPLVMALVDHLRKRGWRPGVISRGHGRRGGTCLEVRPDARAEDCGDEPLLIRQRCGIPVFVAASRLDAGRALMQAHPEVDLIVSDDGLQHHRLARDLNIAVFDERGLGNGRLLPAGPLREPWPRPPWAHDRLRGIDLIIGPVSAADPRSYACPRRLASFARSSDGSSIALDDLRGQRLQAWAGIAKPAQFFDMLRQKGLQLEACRAWPDHHAYSIADLPDDTGLTVLLTEKDAVKLMPLAGSAGPRFLSVPLDIEPEAAFFDALEAAMRAWPRPAHPIPSAHGHSTS